MGMAASQARYIELTARKTNVEYEGQQINQQRTTLANESAGMFSKLMALNVPIPPSTTDYTTTQYTFNTGGTENTITDISNKSTSAENNATVTYYYEDTQYLGAFSQRSDLQLTQVSDGGTPPTYTYYYGTTKLSAYDAASDETAVKQIANDCASTNVAKNYKASETTDIYSYKQGGQTYYVSLDELTTDPASPVEPVTSCYAANTTKKVYNTSEAYLEQNQSGRYTSIQLDGYSNASDMTATTTTNEAAYNDAMNEYEYQQTAYQQQVNNINAKTEIIEEQDRTLEMKLKQLDTEQKALSTEMDAVKKVIEKNIEQTFKTFS